jgi:hypothetical protein
VKAAYRDPAEWVCLECLEANGTVDCGYSEHNSISVEGGYDEEAMDLCRYFDRVDWFF